MFVSSDQHFWHDKVLEFQAHTRPFSDLKEMHEAYIDNWNSCATKPGIKMFHVGDFSFGLEDQTEEICKQLQGDITFIVGNHDRSYTRSVMEKYGRVVWYDEVKYQKHLFILSHYPMLTWNKSHRGSIMLHGHEHGNLVHTEESRGKTMDVGIDVHGRFLHFDEIIEMMKDRPLLEMDHRRILVDR